MLSLPNIIRSDTVYTDNLKGCPVFNKPVFNHHKYHNKHNNSYKIKPSNCSVSSKPLLALAKVFYGSSFASDYYIIKIPFNKNANNNTSLILNL